MREASSDAELDDIIYAMGQDLKKIMNVAKSAALSSSHRAFLITIDQEQSA
jgi:hypothetical protein